METDDLRVIHDIIHDIVLNGRLDVLSNQMAEVDPTHIYMGGHSNGCTGSLATGQLIRISLLPCAAMYGN
jgi:hypothetical protein